MTAALSKNRTRGTLWEFARFVATGSIAAVTNLVARYLLDIALPFETAVVLAYLIGMVVAFLMFQRLFFANPATPLRRRIVRFTLVNFLGLALAWAVSTVLARIVLPAIGWSFHPFEAAHFAGVAVPAFSSFFLHRSYTFR
ncbi:MAG: GtrA family protein [Alphaproteobacteria bacterium]|nr:GtrA family protein [Alphaproteobacteria bacterium]